MDNQELQSLYTSQSSNRNNYVAAQEKKAALNDRIEQNGSRSFARTEKMAQELSDLKDEADRSITDYIVNDTKLMEASSELTKEQMAPFAELDQEFVEDIKGNMPPVPQNSPLQQPASVAPSVPIPIVQSYVSAGAKMICPFAMGGTSALVVTPDRRTSMQGPPKANIMDNKPLVNIPPFGVCSSLANPQVAAATAAAMGVLTPQPCIPNIVAPWAPGKANLMVQGQPALLNTDTLQCLWGGVITIMPDPSIHTGSAPPTPPKPKKPTTGIILYFGTSGQNTGTDSSEPSADSQSVGTGEKSKPGFLELLGQESLKKGQDRAVDGLGFVADEHAVEYFVKEEVILTQKAETLRKLADNESLNQSINLEKLRNDFNNAGYEYVKLNKTQGMPSYLSRDSLERANDARKAYLKAFKEANKYYQKANGRWGRFKDKFKAIGVKPSQFVYDKLLRDYEFESALRQDLHNRNIAIDKAKLKQDVVSSKKNYNYRRTAIQLEKRASYAGSNKYLNKLKPQLLNYLDNRLKRFTSFIDDSLAKTDVGTMFARGIKLFHNINNNKYVDALVTPNRFVYAKIFGAPDKGADELAGAAEKKIAQEAQEATTRYKQALQDADAATKKAASAAREADAAWDAAKTVFDAERFTTTEEGLRAARDRTMSHIGQAAEKSGTAVKAADEAAAKKAVAATEKKAMKVAVTKGTGTIIVKGVGKALGPAITLVTYGFEDTSDFNRETKKGYATSMEDVEIKYSGKELNSWSDWGEFAGDIVGSGLQEKGVWKPVANFANFVVRDTAGTVDLAVSLVNHDNSPITKLYSGVVHKVFSDEHIDKRLKELGLQNDEDARKFNLAGAGKIIGAGLAEKHPLSTDHWLMDFHDTLLRMSKGLPL